MNTHHDAMDDTGDFAVSEAGYRIDTHRPIPACSDYCAQGRKPCPCPQACQRPDPEPYDSKAGTGVIKWGLYSAALGFACWLLFGLLSSAGVFAS